mgnify:CR=1 FL=1
MALAKSWFSIHPTNGKVHTAAQFNAKYNHNYREKTPINANPEKEHLNEELIKLEEDSFQAAFKKKIKQIKDSIVSSQKKIYSPIKYAKMRYVALNSLLILGPENYQKGLI